MRPVLKVENLIAIFRTDFLENVGVCASHYPIGLHILLKGELYFFSPHSVERSMVERSYSSTVLDLGTGWK
jgi:hypothetical protein